MKSILRFATVALGFWLGAAVALPAPAQTANPDATAATRQTLKTLATLPTRPGHPIVSGQLIGTLDGLAFGPDDDMINGYAAYVEALKKLSGKTVGLVGANFGRLNTCRTPNPLFPAGHSPFMNCDGSTPAFPRDIDLLVKHWQAGGLVTVMWQAQNPWTGNNAQDHHIAGAFADLTTPGSPIFATWRKMLDEEALLLAQLRDRGVVVLFRPFHEQNGNWFWWGDHGADGHPTPAEFAALWRDMFKYFTDDKKLNNLLWVFAPNYTNNPDALLERDPGKAFYDIIGIDYYEHLDERQINLNSLISAGKPLALTEYGPSESFENQPGQKDQFDFLRLQAIRERFPHFSYFMAWNGSHLPQAMMQNRDADVLLKRSDVLNLGDLKP